MNTVAIVQARTGSTRFPAKVLADIGGRSMLARVVRRVRRARRVDTVLVATTTRSRDDVLVEECSRLAVACFRGDEDDVLDRFVEAARSVGAATVVRITADCPMIDPGVIDHVCDAFRSARPDYASNTLQRTYPRGLDTEVMTAAALERCGREASQSWERSHVTPYLYRHPDRFRLLSVTGKADHSRHRWTVDVGQDLELVCSLYARLGDDDHFDWRQALALVESDPGLAALNSDVVGRALEEG